MSSPQAPAPKPLGTTEWLICFIAVIGFAFDIYELLMLPLIVKPAIAALSAPLIEQLVQAGTPRPEAVALWIPGGTMYVEWARTLFFVPAIFGGIFGLIGGYLTDRLGRRRVLTFSILLYAFAAGAAGLSTSLWELLFFRCLVFIGVCVEFVAAVAWLAELFPNPAQREKVLGFTQAFSSVGGFMVSGAYLLCVHFANSLPAIHGGHDAWRYTLISGLIPAIPLILIRPFLPESPVWARKRETGQLKRQPRRAVQAGIGPDHHCHRRHRRFLLRHGFRRDPAPPTNRPRPGRREGRREGQTGRDGSSRSRSGQTRPGRESSGRRRAAGD